jgi:uncharacterized membrane protein YeaQ/YmgE (transglycosylase-associated protein family)
MGTIGNIATSMIMGTICNIAMGMIMGTICNIAMGMITGAICSKVLLTTRGNGNRIPMYWASLNVIQTWQNALLSQLWKN